MPRLNRPPAYRHHKARNLAVVHIGGKDIYLGPYGSPESQEKYARLRAERGQPNFATPASIPSEDGRTTSTINELILAYLNFAEP